MVSVPSPFGGSDDSFDGYDEFVPASVPAPGEFLDGHDVLADRRHLAFHRLTRELFEERAVYDMTFGYNLARLNCDVRHPDAGYRYAVEAGEGIERDADGDADPAGSDDRPAADDDDLPGIGGDARVLRAEFTPTTAFCPQSDTLTKGSFRAWNGLADRHEFDLVRVRVAPMHQRATAINAALRDLETTFAETGSLPDPAENVQESLDGGGPADLGGDQGPAAPF